jgi:flagellar basal body rod protein FlgB
MDTNPNQAIADSRVEAWKQAVEQELQDLLQQASSIRQNITNSKTPTKKAYYAKKFKKVQREVMSMVVTKQRLNGMTRPTAPATEDSSDANTDPVA